MDPDWDPKRHFHWVFDGIESPYLRQQGKRFSLQPIEKNPVSLLWFLLLNPVTTIEGVNFEIRNGCAHIQFRDHVMLAVDHKTGDIDLLFDISRGLPIT
jgi:hypothetical protein